MKVCFLQTGYNAYQDALYDELVGCGNDVLLVYPRSLAFSNYDDSAYSDRVQRFIWDKEPPTDEELMARLEEFGPDAIVMSSWHVKPYRAAMRAYAGRALRVLQLGNFWIGSWKQRAGLVIRRWYVTPLYDAAWVPGIRSEMFVRQLGFRARNIIRGANSADVAVYDRGPREEVELSQSRRFIFVGRLIWHKAPEELAEAYRAYRAQVSDPWALDVIGSGPLDKAFEGIDGVVMHGFKQPEEVVDLMRAASVFVLPSHMEWYGVVVHEAAAAALPLICADMVGATPHLLQDGYNGVVVESGDVRSLTDALLRMHRLEPARLHAMSQASHQLAARLTPAIAARNLHDELELRVGWLREGLYA